LASTGSEAMVARISEIVKSDESPEIMLQQLEAAAQKFGPVGDSMGTNLIEGLKSSLSQVGALEEATGLKSRFTESARVAAAAGGEAVGPAMAASINLDPAIQKVQEFENIIVSTPLSPMTVTADLSQAIQAVTQFENTLVSTAASPITITADTSVAISQVDALRTKISQLAQSTIPKISVDNSAAISQVDAVKAKITALAQSKPPSIQVNNAAAIPQIAAVQTKLNAIKQTRIPTVKVNASQAFSTISQVQSKLNGLKNISRTITYRYKTVGSPPRGAQSGMHETLAEDTLIQAHKGERVDIGATGAGTKNYET